MVREETSRLILTDDKRIYLLPIAYAYIRMSNTKQYQIDFRLGKEGLYWRVSIGDNKFVCVDVKEGVVYKNRVDRLDIDLYDVAEWYDIEACDRIICKLANKMKQHLGEQNE